MGTETIAKRLKWARDARGLSLVDAAKAAGISHGAVWNYENGFNLPTPAVLAALATVYDVSAEYLLKGAS